MEHTALDYYVKGLPIDVRQQLHDHLHSQISPTMVKWFLEKESGYQSFRSCGFSDEEIRLVGESYAERFELPNRIMAEHGRPPLFSDPGDSCQSAKEYDELLRPRSETELVARFGRTFREYAPAGES